MKCPKCGKGEIYVYEPKVALYQYTTEDDGSTGNFVDDEVIDETAGESYAECDLCEAKFELDEDGKIIKPIRKYMVHFCKWSSFEVEATDMAEAQDKGRNLKDCDIESNSGDWDLDSVDRAD